VLAILLGQMPGQVAGNAERKAAIDQGVEDLRMAAAAAADLGFEPDTALGQSQTIHAVLEQGRVAEFHVESAEGYLGDVRDQPHNEVEFCSDEEIGLVLEFVER